ETVTIEFNDLSSECLEICLQTFLIPRQNDVVLLRIAVGFGGFVGSGSGDVLDLCGPSRPIVGRPAAHRYRRDPVSSGFHLIKIERIAEEHSLPRFVALIFGERSCAAYIAEFFENLGDARLGCFTLYFR